MDIGETVLVYEWKAYSLEAKDVQCWSHEDYILQGLALIYQKECIVTKRVRQCQHQQVELSAISIGQLKLVSCGLHYYRFWHLFTRKDA